MNSASNNQSTNSQESGEKRLSIVEQAVDSTSTTALQDDTRKQPWRVMPEFEAFEDKVHVSKVRDMRLFGNHVNAHS